MPWSPEDVDQIQTIVARSEHEQRQEIQMAVTRSEHGLREEMQDMKTELRQEMSAATSGLTAHLLRLEARMIEGFESLGAVIKRDEKENLSSFSDIYHRLDGVEEDIADVRSWEGLPRHALENG